MEGGGERHAGSGRPTGGARPWLGSAVWKLSERPAAPLQLPGKTKGVEIEAGVGGILSADPLSSLSGSCPGWLSVAGGFDVNPLQSLSFLHSSPASHHELDYGEEMEPQIRAARDI